MSPEGRAPADLSVLAAEVRDDLEAIDRLARRALEARERVLSAPSPDPADVMAVAGFLHHAYTAMESIHERIVSVIDGAGPRGDRWHQELLTRVGLAIDGVRPAVVSAATRAQLSRLLRFRHFFRHAYRIDLLWVEVAPLAADLGAVVATYREDLGAFLEHIEAARRG